MTAVCLIAGCGQPAASPRALCLSCHQHAELLEAISKAKPKPASPHTLGTERTCGNCVWFVEGERLWSDRDQVWRWDMVTAGHGDCRANAPRPVDSDRREFPRIHRDDWCRFHQMRRDHHRPGQP